MSQLPDRDTTEQTSESQQPDLSLAPSSLLTQARIRRSSSRFRQDPLISTSPSSRASSRPRLHLVEDSIDMSDKQAREVMLTKSKNQDDESKSVADGETRHAQPLSLALPSSSAAAAAAGGAGGASTTPRLIITQPQRIDPAAEHKHAQSPLVVQKSALQVPPLPYRFRLCYAILRDTDGRDKLLKCVQYASRLIKWYVLNYPQTATLLMSLASRIFALLQRFGPQMQQRALLQSPDANAPIAKSSVASIAPASPSNSNALVTTTSAPQQSNHPIVTPIHFRNSTSESFEIISSGDSTPPAASVAPPNASQLSALHETLVASRLKRMLAYIDHLSSTISAARRIIRLAKWMYTLPLLHKNYYKWRAACEQVLHQAECDQQQQQQNAARLSSPSSAIQHQQLQSPNSAHQFNHNNNSNDSNNMSINLTSMARDASDMSQSQHDAVECLAHGANAPVDICPSTCLGRPNALEHSLALLNASQHSPSITMPHERFKSLFNLDRATSRFLLLHLPWVSTVEMLNSVLAVWTDLCDDADWLARYSLFPQELGLRLGRLSVICWFVTCVVDLTLTLRTLRLHHRLMTHQLRQLTKTRQRATQAAETLQAMQTNRLERQQRKSQQQQSSAPSHQRSDSVVSVVSSAHSSVGNSPRGSFTSASTSKRTSTQPSAGKTLNAPLLEDQLLMPSLTSAASKSDVKPSASLRSLAVQYSDPGLKVPREEQNCSQLEQQLRHQASEQRQQVMATRCLVQASLINFCKFLSDLGVSLPGVMQANQVHDGLIQLSGFCSGAVGIYKLALLVPAEEK